MSPSARLYHCLRCHRQVIVCRYCDRGQVYCLSGCAHRARQESLRRASRRYQGSRRGRFTNAARQQRFRTRQREKVTHQGSAVFSTSDLLVRTRSRPVVGDGNKAVLTDSGLCCHQCQRPCDPFLRQDFLRRSQRGRRWRSR